MGSGVGGGIGGGMGGIGGGVGGGMGGGMETTAAMKAEIVMRSFNVVKDAPEHIKEASIRLAGKALTRI